VRRAQRFLAVARDRVVLRRRPAAFRGAEVTPVTRALPFLALAVLLAGCPEERPGAQKQVPAQRVPPAVSVEPTLADGGLPPLPLPLPDAGAARARP
jgi:hypothetical protein